MAKSSHLILDIDDTLAETALTAISEMREEFKHPTSVWKLIAKYQQPGNVPEWKSLEAQEYLLRIMNDEDFLLNLPRVPGSLEVLTKLINEYPIRYYMTSRYSSFEEVTLKWLKNNHFPLSQIIFRDETNIDKDWKLKYLIKKGINDCIFIDNDLQAFDSITREYRGKLIWLNRFKLESNLSITSLSSWESIYQFLRQ